MDDLKLYAKDDSELEGFLRIVKGSDDIGMDFGLSKCAKTTFKRGKLEMSDHVQLDKETKICCKKKFISTLALTGLVEFDTPQ